MQILDRIIQWFYRYVRKVQDKKMAKKYWRQFLAGFVIKLI
jgi:hypothetical protein